MAYVIDTTQLEEVLDSANYKALVNLEYLISDAQQKYAQLYQILISPFIIPQSISHARLMCDMAKTAHMQGDITTFLTTLSRNYPYPMYIHDGNLRKVPECIRAIRKGVLLPKGHVHIGLTFSEASDLLTRQAYDTSYISEALKESTQTRAAVLKKCLSLIHKRLIPEKGEPHDLST